MAPLPGHVKRVRKSPPAAVGGSNGSGGGSLQVLLCLAHAGEQPAGSSSQQQHQAAGQREEAALLGGVPAGVLQLVQEHGLAPPFAVQVRACARCVHRRLQACRVLLCWEGWLVP